jgi:uncharacterized protein YjbJ (UPF0337 family)
MDENRVAGTAKNAGGKLEEGFGRVTGDNKMRAEGLVDQAAGTAQDLYGQARDSAAGVADAARLPAWAARPAMVPARRFAVSYGSE